ncbi:TetR/AcrR family transcriptional regulator [Nocardia amamiensis]|uniref:TetR/AcrR family transcriptional regulator n=1 Tax=Nocardia amamiensis TaxID=404578 RepID=A0ABS0CK48_9NOCA|nr:TetR/AcrR family transcriptional regulator [Nocardia amamiensis]MBF6296993.1 TetR/AcrR family transcriptional regulator [Nocardia amamiensis]
MAVFEAVIAGLVDSGYGGLTIDGVAARAHISKTSMYRYWPSKEELVLDTIRGYLPPIQDVPYSGSIREDFLQMLRNTSALAASPTGIAIAGLLTEAHRHPALARAVFEQIIEPRQRIMLESLHRAAIRGEISPGAVTLLPIQVAVGVVNIHQLQFGAPPSDDELIQIVDQAVLPILGLTPDQKRPDIA